MENPLRLSFWRNLLTRREPSQENFGTCSWTLCYSDPPKSLHWRTSPTFYVNGASDYSFNILTRVNTTGNLAILIRKNELKKNEELKPPSAAKIKINIPNYFCQMVKVNEWTDACCSFNNIVSLSTMPLCKNCTGARFVRIVCEITWFGISDEEEPLPLSIRNMANYFMSSELSDVTLVVNNEEIPAHKVVLASQSKIILEMLKSKLQIENRIVLHDVDIDALKIALKYLYSGDSTALNNVDTLKKVLAIANNYEIDKLSIFCEHKLRQSLNIENVVSIIGLSKELKVLSLYDSSLRFISANEDQMVQRNEFKELCLKNPEITVSLIGLRKTR